MIAQLGFGGKVTVNVQAIFGSEFRPVLTQQSDITATSEAGADAQGIVLFNSPDFDPEQALANLPDNVTLTFQPIASAYTASSLQNRFIVSGRGGIPANRSNSLRSETTWNDMRPISRRQSQNSQNQSYTKNYRNLFKNSDKLIEAQGFGVDAEGGIELIASNMYQLHNLHYNFINFPILDVINHVSTQHSALSTTFTKRRCNQTATMFVSKQLIANDSNI